MISLILFQNQEFFYNFFTMGRLHWNAEYLYSRDNLIYLKLSAVKAYDKIKTHIQQREGNKTLCTSGSDTFIIFHLKYHY